MFEPQEKPRVFALPPGVDFPGALVDGMDARLNGQPPEALARASLIVNTRRMARRLRTIYDAGPPRLLPRISLVDGLSETALADVPAAVSPLRRRLELVQLVSRLLESEPDLAPRAALYDLADSLASLFDEMQGEAVPAEVIRSLDVSDQSGHWVRALKFISIVEQVIDADGIDPQQRQRQVVENLIGMWQESPPGHPVILAGSTGSRGTTLLLMEAVARLPQGALVLPGFDFDLPRDVWAEMGNALSFEDHPQYRFRRLMDQLGIGPEDIRPWVGTPAPAPKRNHVLSLALRPAPVTDAWMREGPDLPDLPGAMTGITLIEAESPREEALAIALRLRQAAEDGQSAALITPDRMLTRQVEAALDRWKIVADDSAGQPLHLSPPGRFLRQVTQLFSAPLTGAALLTLLKHPLCHSGTDRNEHLRHTRDLELFLRRKGPPHPGEDTLAEFADTGRAPKEWLDWLSATVLDRHAPDARPLPQRVIDLRNAAEAIAGGAGATDPGELWLQRAGQEALKVITALETDGAAGGNMTAREFEDLLGALLQRETVRDRDKPHPDIMVWGTLEARVMGADLLILGGLNEGSWPEPAQPDPWLNRALRQQARLLLPERRIGLSAHDFQQAAGAAEVWMTRSRRSDDADTVPSRWLNRISNLLAGLPARQGPRALQDMRDRGKTWLERARLLDVRDETEPSPRPSPCPPVIARPDRLSVTKIKQLIRDPYAVYARHVLRLKPLDPLVPEPDALSRGVAVHTALERFVAATLENRDLLTANALMNTAAEVLEAEVPWAAERRLWLARLSRVADWFVGREAERQAEARPEGFEVKGKITFGTPPFTLSGTADRIDSAPDGRLVLYDYKTGRAPSPKEQTFFDKQLLLEAAMAEDGGFDGIPPAEVAEATFIGLGAGKEVAAPLDEEPTAKIRAELAALIEAYRNPDQGFTSRRALHKDTDVGDYDHLARFGEWDRASTPKKLVLK